MKLSHIFEDNTSTSLGQHSGIQINVWCDTKQLYKKITPRDMRVLSTRIVSRIVKLNARKILLQNFTVDVPSINIKFNCRFYKKTKTFVIVDFYKGAADDNLSILTISNINEIFTNVVPLRYRGYTVIETDHSQERIQDREITQFVSQTDIERLVRMGIDKFEIADLLDLKIKFAMIYSESMRQAIIIEVDGTTVSVATYLPNNNRHVATNCVYIEVV